MKKNIFKVGFITLIILFTFITGVLAGTNFDEITAYLNKGVSMTWNGEPFYVYEEDGTRLYPISYKGRNYIPARFVAEKSGVQVGWDADTLSISFTDPDYIETKIVKGTYKQIGSGTVRVLDDISEVTESGFNVEETLAHDSNGIHIIKLSWASGDANEKRSAHILYAEEFNEILSQEFKVNSYNVNPTGHITGSYIDINNTLRIDFYSTDTEVIITSQFLI